MNERRRRRKQAAIDQLILETRYKEQIAAIVESLEHLAEENKIDVGGPIDEVHFVDSDGSILVKFDREGMKL